MPLVLCLVVLLLLPATGRGSKMATVPTYRNQAVSTIPDQTPFTRALPDPSRGLVQGVQQGLGTLAAAATRFEDQANEREAKELDVEYSSRTRDLLFGSEETPGFLSLQGQAALRERGNVQTRLNEIREEVGGRATNGASREMFSASAGARQQRQLDSISRHSLRANAVANEETSNARLGEALQDAAANFTDPEAIRRSLALGVMEIRTLGEQNGLTSEAIASRQEEFETVTHRAVVDRFLANGRVQEAREYYQGNIESIDGDVRADVERSLSVAGRAAATSLTRQVSDAVDVLDVGGSPAGIAQLRAAAASNPAQSARLEEAFSSAETIRLFNGLPLSGQGVAINTLRTRIQEGESTGRDARMLAKLSKAHAYNQKEVEQGRGLQVAFQNGIIGQPPPLNVRNPDADVLSERRDQARMASIGMRADISPLTNDEVEEITEVILGDGTPLDTVVSLMDTYTESLGPEWSKRLAQQAVQKYPAAAVAFSVASERPRLARDLIEGSRLLKETPGLALAASPRIKTVAVDAVLKNLTTEFTAGMLTPITAAADAIYAKKRLISGDLDSIGTQTLYQEAIEEVTGGMLRHNGRSNLPPEPGMSQSQFDDLLGGLTTQSLARYGNGRPVIGGESFTPEDLEGRSFFQGGVENQLVSIGQGAYSILQPGNGWIKTEDGETYVLELGNLAKEGGEVIPSITEEGLDLIRQFEGFREDAYADPGDGTQTIGYGSTRDLEGNPITEDHIRIDEATANQLLERDVQESTDSVLGLVEVDLTDNQLSALVSLVYNIGAGNFRSSTLLRLLNDGDYAGAANEFREWRMAGGEVLPGLVARRAREARLFRAN